MKLTAFHIFIFALLIGVTSHLLVACSGKDDHSNASTAEINCDIQAGPCEKATEFGTVTLEITPRPVRAMTDLRFRLSLTGISPAAAPYIDLNMLAMDMGFNRVYLNPAGPGIYEGPGVIVRCPSGIPVWQADVVIPGAGHAEFVFHVQY